MEVSKHTKKTKKNQTLEGKFRFDLDTCSKKKDLSAAISLYDFAISHNIRLNHYHFNAFLYICSNSVAEIGLSSETSASEKTSASEYGFRIFDHMLASNIKPTEATITAVARLAAAKDDGNSAFDLVKSMGKYGVSPKLRSYDPALFCFCRNSETEKAFEIEEHMASMGVRPEEPEIAALLKVSADKGMGDRVYGYLHKLRCSLGCVSESTAKIIEEWFGGDVASEVGMLNWDNVGVADVILRNGGGWHGLGWFGTGNWVVCRSNVDSGGHCCSCNEQLVCVDIDTAETDKFAHSVTSLAMEREVQSNFLAFKDWLDQHSEYEAIVDGANIGLFQQNFADGGFSISQLQAVVGELYKRSNRWPLVILHNKRIRSLLENASNRELIEKWKNLGVLYGTPSGSNDDWYWLYAAVKLKCLLVTNDEMRDHIFELLGSSFFLKWKERHQMRYTFMKGNLKLHMPPSYSVVIQESEKGTWHVPIAGETNDESGRTWLCITRPGSGEASGEIPATTIKASEIDQLHSDSSKLMKACHSKSATSSQNGNSDSLEIVESKLIATTGKRKERSPSPSKPDDF